MIIGGENTANINSIKERVKHPYLHNAFVKVAFAFSDAFCGDFACLLYMQTTLSKIRKTYTEMQITFQDVKGKDYLFCSPSPAPPILHMEGMIAGYTL